MSEEKKAHKHFWIRPRKISKGPTYNCTTNLMKYAGYTDVTHVIEYSALEQAQAEIERLKARMTRARKLILDDLKDSPNCECGADNGSNYTDVICYRHAAIMELMRCV